MYLWGKWGGGGPTVSPSVTAVMTWACRALIDFEGVLELDETVSSLRYHVETFK